MRKVNFHTLDNLTVPPALIEKALAIPASSENTPAILPWYRRSRMIAAAASIVLVVLAGISVYLVFGNNKIPVKPSGTSDVPIAADTTTSDGTHPADPTGSGAVEPHSERPTGTAAQSETIDASSAPQPTVITPGGTPATESNNEHTDATELPSTKEATERSTSTEDATKEPDNQPTESPATQPTVTPTRPAIEIPTAPPWEEYSDSPVAPSQTIKPIRYYETSVYYPNQKFRGSVYCLIRNYYTGELLGDPDPYDASHMAEYSLSGHRLTFRYDLTAHGIYVPSGNTAYRCTFVNEEGVLIATGVGCI